MRVTTALETPLFGLRYLLHHQTMNSVQTFFSFFPPLFWSKGPKTGKASGTLFIVEDGWGYDLQPYSLFQEESEILFEHERQFKVASVIRSDLIIVKLTMLPRLYTCLISLAMEIKKGSCFDNEQI